MVERICSAAPINKCEKLGKHLCAGCGEEVYCSKECQKEHWAAHKLSCTLAVKPEATPFLNDFSDLSVKQLKNALKAKVANYEKKKKAAILARMDDIIEKPVLVKLVSEHVTLPEVEVLLSGNKSAPEGASSSFGKKSSSSSRSKGEQPTPTPDQLRQQATMMRKNPQMVRDSQPAFNNMTNEQIMAYADQLEQAASDPEMMKEVEKMSKLSNVDRNALQSIQDGVTGNRPLDSAWFDTTIATLKSKPKLFKTLLKGKGSMLGGVTDEQIDAFVDMASNMETWILKLIMQGFKWLASMYRPVTDAYKILDDYTLGCGKWIVMAIVVWVGSYVAIFWWACMKYIIRWLYVAFHTVFYSGQAVTTPVSAASSGAAEVAKTAAAAAVGAAGAAAAVGAAGAAAGALSNAVPERVASMGAAGGAAAGSLPKGKGQATPDDEFEF